MSKDRIVAAKTLVAHSQFHDAELQIAQWAHDMREMVQSGAAVPPQSLQQMRDSLACLLQEVRQKRVRLLMERNRLSQWPYGGTETSAPCSSWSLLG